MYCWTLGTQAKCDLGVHCRRVDGQLRWWEKAGEIPVISNKVTSGVQQQTCRASLGSTNCAFCANINCSSGWLFWLPGPPRQSPGPPSQMFRVPRPCFCQWIDGVYAVTLPEFGQWCFIGSRKCFPFWDIPKPTWCGEVESVLVKTEITKVHVDNTDVMFSRQSKQSSGRCYCVSGSGNLRMFLNGKWKCWMQLFLST